MRKILVSIVLLIVILQTAYSQEKNNGKIIFYRDKNHYGSAFEYKLYANDSLITRLKNNSYYEYDCKSGVYNISINKLDKTSIKINVIEGKNYYVRLIVNMGMWSSQTELIQVDSLMASSRIYNGDMKKIEKNNFTFSRPKNRIGLNVAIGGGFEKFGVFSMTNLDTSYISLGGGYALGIKYGYEFSKHFDISFDANYQISMLIPYLSNVRTNFNRGVISFTPSYIISIRDGEAMRFKLGAGYDYYWDARLIIQGKSIPDGFDATWIYKDAHGFHFSLNYEMKISERWSVNYGLKYYNIKYNFRESLSTKIPSDRLTSPDGSGIDFVTGIYYNF